MLDDHAVSYGRRTNGKYIILLLALALIALLTAWALEHKGNIQSTLSRLLLQEQSSMDWKDAPSNGASSVFGCDDGAVLLTDGILYHLDMAGTVTAQLDTGEDALTPLSGSIPGAWGKNTLYLWNEGAFSSVPVETGILGACATEKHIALISKGSGYLTNTILLDASGKKLGSIGLTNAAMTELAVTEDVLAGLCMDKLGQWSLRLYDFSGKLRNEIPLGEESQCHILGMAQGFLVLMAHSVRFYDIDGTETGCYTLPEGTVSCGTVTGNGAVVLADCGSMGTLYFISSAGKLLGETAISTQVRRLIARADRVYVLDYQALRVYDKQGGLLATRIQGARAADLSPHGSNLWLAGNGEVSRISIS